MHPSRYRTRLFLDFFRAFILPSAALFFTLRLTGKNCGLVTVPAYVFFVIVWAIAKGAYFNVVQAKEAEQLGAKPIPRIVGKWPGNIDILIKMMRAFKTSYVLDVYLQLFEEYQCTTLNTRIFWMDHIITMDQEHSKFILTTGFSRFWRGIAQKERMETLLGEGIFNRDGEKWKMHRTIARPFFARERISDFELLERHSARTISLLSALASSGEPCEAQDLYARFTLDAASEFLFGKNLDTLSSKLPIPGVTAMGPKGSATDDSWGKFTQAFEMSQQIITTRGRLGYLWPLFELFGDKSVPHASVIRQWLDPLVKQAIEDKVRMARANIDLAVEEKTFLQHLADSTEDVALIRDQLLSVLLASRDTTASLLTFITYFMAIHPDVTLKLRAEVLEFCGAQGAPTYEQIRNLKYMRAVINETLRLFPSVPLNVRESQSASVVMPPSDPSYANAVSGSPLYMPKNTVITFLPLLIQRNPALWGPDADTFDPDRWIQPGSVSRLLNNPAMFAPFSAGPRICLGQNYAYNQVSYFLVRLLQQFDTFSLAPEFQPNGSLPPAEWKYRKGRQSIERVWPAAALTLYVKGGMWVRCGRAKS